MSFHHCGTTNSLVGLKEMARMEQQRSVLIIPQPLSKQPADDDRKHSVSLCALQPIDSSNTDTEDWPGKKNTFDSICLSVFQIFSHKMLWFCCSLKRTICLHYILHIFMWYLKNWETCNIWAISTTFSPFKLAYVWFWNESFTLRAFFHILDLFQCKN